MSAVAFCFYGVDLLISKKIIFKMALIKYIDNISVFWLGCKCILYTAENRTCFTAKITLYSPVQGHN